MNTTHEELDPLSLPASSHGSMDFSLSELVAEHPLLALGAATALGIGVGALVAGLAQRRPTPVEAATDQSTQAYRELRAQLARLAERVSAALPADTIRQTSADLGKQVERMVHKASGAAQESFTSAAASGRSAIKTAGDHPILASVLIGALGTAITALASGARNGSAATAQTPADGQDAR
jgi:hypothetical protein